MGGIALSSIIRILVGKKTNRSIPAWTSAIGESFGERNELPTRLPLWKIAANESEWALGDEKLLHFFDFTSPIAASRDMESYRDDAWAPKRP